MFSKSFTKGLLIELENNNQFELIETDREKIDWKRFFYGFFVWGIIALAFSYIAILLSPEHYTWNFNATPFFILVAISFLFLPFQTSLEELLFRGYFMQGIGVLAKNRWVPLLITSVVFGLLHGANPEVAKLGQITMVFYIGTGLFYGIVTLMDEGTEIALGLHAINNIVAAFFVTTDWTVFQTDALYIDTSEPSVTWEMFLPVFILYPLMLFLFSKKVLNKRTRINWRTEKKSCLILSAPRPRWFILSKNNRLASKLISKHGIINRYSSGINNFISRIWSSYQRRLHLFDEPATKCQKNC